MVFSDAIYGKAPRYVSRERLTTMARPLNIQLLVERLPRPPRHSRTSFFRIADTVATRNFKGDNDAHGWMGIRFQIHPQEPPTTSSSTCACGTRRRCSNRRRWAFRVNVIYGAFFYRISPEKFIRSLVDSLSTARIEVDMLKFAGPAFAQVDSRLLSLLLVQYGADQCRDVGPDGDVLQPSEVLHRKAILVERGSFRPRDAGQRRHAELHDGALLAGAGGQGQTRHDSVRRSR